MTIAPRSQCIAIGLALLFLTGRQGTAADSGSNAEPKTTETSAAVPVEGKPSRRIWPSNSPLPSGTILVDAIVPPTRPREKIETALDMITNVEFPANPLRDIVEFLSHQHDIPILLDRRALAENGISEDEEISIVLSGATLRTALDLMLREIGLTAAVDKETLLITTPSVAAGIMETRIYDVRPLNIEDPQALVAVIQAVVSDGWGPQMIPSKEGIQSVRTISSGAQISYFRGSFVIRQTESAHREIEAVLNVLARQIQAHPDSPNWPAAPAGTGHF
jgi:hypothetical protein